METNVIKDTSHGRTDVFEIVSNYPGGYVVWAIGRENFPHKCYVPLARPVADYHIDLSSLKAIKVKDEKTALAILKEASLRGVDERKFNDLINSQKS